MQANERDGAQTFRIVAWNIRAGGGVRVDQITQILQELAPDTVVLSEFRSTAPSTRLSHALHQQGLLHQRSTTAQVSPGANALLIASRTPLRRVALKQYPREPGRWLIIRLQQPRLTIAGVHVPNQHTGRKPQFHDAILSLMRRWRGGPAIVIGDTNSGKRDEDEERPVFNQRTTRWFELIHASGWRDAFRHLHGAKREYTWYSPGHDNGFRLDQAFVSRELSNQISHIQHLWPRDPNKPNARDAISDHAALVLDLNLPIH